MENTQQNEATPKGVRWIQQEEAEKLKYLIRNLNKPSDTYSLVHSSMFPSSIRLNVSDTTFFQFLDHGSRS